MSSGHIVFASTHKGWFPAAVRWISGSKWSHCLLTTPSYLGRNMCIEGSGQGVDLVDFDIAYRNNPDQNYEVYCLIRTPSENKDRALNELLMDLEDPYSYLSLPWFIYRYLLRRIGIDIKHKNNWYHNLFICSGLVRKYLDLCDLSCLTTAYGVGSLSAEDLYQLVRSRPYLFKMVEKKGK